MIKARFFFLELILLSRYVDMNTHVSYLNIVFNIVMYIFLKNNFLFVDI